MSASDQNGNSYPRRTILGLALGATAVPALNLFTSTPASAATKLVAYNATDATANIQSALNDINYDVVIIPAASGDWITGPLWIKRSNLTVIFEPGVTLRPKAGAYAGTIRDSMLVIDRCSNVTVRGYGATLAMNRDEYPEEQHSCLRVHAASAITVEGLTLRGSPGDGITLSKSFSASPPAQNYPQNVTMRNVLCDDNSRNGMSVITIDGLVVEGSAFINSHGKSPEAGVDIEPDVAGQPVKNIVMRNCVTTGNAQAGVTVNVFGLDAASPPVSILVDKLYTSTSPINLFSVSGPHGTGTSDPGGLVELRDSLVDGTASGARTNIYRTPSYDGLATKFTRVSWWGWNSGTRLTSQIRLWSGESAGNILPHYGNVTWDHGVVVTDRNAPFLDVYEVGSSLGPANLNGDITVINPHGATMNLGPTPSDINVAVTPLLSAPAVTATISASASTVAAGGIANITFTRSPSSATRPLTIKYTLSGTAKNRYDYDGLAGVACIPPGQTATTIPLQTRRPDNGTGTRTVIITMAAHPSYTLGTPSTKTISITAP